MNIVKSIEKIQKEIQRIKECKKGYLTNLFLDINKLEFWIKLNKLKIFEFRETTFLLKENIGFSNLFYISTCFESLEIDLNKLIGTMDSTIIVEVVGKEFSIIAPVLEKNGFTKYTSFVRMSRVVNEDKTEFEESDKLYYLEVNKSNYIQNLLYKYFDIYAEQIPSLQELVNLAKENKIIYYSNDSENIHGLLIFELTGLTGHLRYWWVHPEYRNKGIGSALIKRFFIECQNSKRQLFWVIETNENAIKRYEHFKFKKEKLFYYIFINKKLKYEG